jgi:hypothetical protein
MKKLFLFIFLANVLQIKAQEHTIGLQIGTISPYSFVELLSVDIFSSGSQKSSSTILGTTYKYMPQSKKIAFGISLEYEKMTFQKSVNSTYKPTIITIAPDLNVIYFNHKGLTLYSNVGLGISYYNGLYSSLAVDGKSLLFNFNAALFCVSYGKKTGFFIEPSLGYKGILNVGVFHKL